MRISPTSRRAFKIIGMTCAIAALACFGFGVSFYYRGLPDKPQPAMGRIYPLNTHGFITYMTQREQSQQRNAFITFGILFAVAVTLDLIFNISDRGSWLRFRRMNRPPWNPRGGPNSLR